MSYYSRKTRKGKAKLCIVKILREFWRFGKTLYICNMIIGSRKARLDDELGISPH